MIKKQSSVLSWQQHNSPEEFVTLTAHGPWNLSLILLRAAFWEYLHTCHCLRFLYPIYSCIIVFDVLFFFLKIICIWLLWGHVLLRVRLLNTIPNSKGINFSLHYHIKLSGRLFLNLKVLKSCIFVLFSSLGAWVAALFSNIPCVMWLWALLGRAGVLS